MINEIFAKFDGAFSANTIRAYRSDITHFMEWCNREGLDFRQAEGGDIANYIEAMAEQYATATIRRRLDSLSSVLNLGQFKNETSHPDARLAMKRTLRKMGRHQQQASALTKQVLNSLLAVCGNDLAGLRNQVLLRLGYETMRRRSELCAFRFEDRVTSPTGKTGLHLNFSKADQFGKGKIIPISPELDTLLDQWADKIGENGYILRGIKPNHGAGDTLSPAGLNIILKRLQAQANLTIEPSLSGHSFRVGRALDLLQEGESMERIMLRGGWTAEATVMRYLRAWEF